MPVLLILLGTGIGAGLTFLGQQFGIVPAPSGATGGAAKTAPDGTAPPPAPTGPVPRSGFLVFPATDDRNQIQGAIFNTKAEADDFARQLSGMLAGATVWRVELKNDRIVPETAFQFGFLQQAG